VAFPTHSRDTPSFGSDFVPELTALKVSKFLDKVEGPLDNIPENARITDFISEEIPGTLAMHHCVARV
jgi:hypothetical protein